MSSPAGKPELQKIFESSLEARPPSQVLKEFSSEGDALSLSEANALSLGEATERYAREAVVGLIIRYGETNDPMQFLLTLRSDALKEHPSQVALPGGVVEKNEGHLEALDREIFEEVGIPVGSIDWVKKHWEPLPSLHGLKVFPYLGFLSRDRAPADLVLQSFEVTAAAWLEFDALFRSELWSRRPLSRAPWQWSGWSHETWGLTAAFLALFLRRISGSYPC